MDFIRHNLFQDYNVLILPLLFLPRTVHSCEIILSLFTM